MQLFKELKDFLQENNDWLSKNTKNYPLVDGDYHNAWFKCCSKIWGWNGTFGSFRVKSGSCNSWNDSYFLVCFKNNIKISLWSAKSPADNAFMANIFGKIRSFWTLFSYGYIHELSPLRRFLHQFLQVMQAFFLRILV